MTWNISTKETIIECYKKYLTHPNDPENWFSSSDKTKWPPYWVLQICFEYYRTTKQWEAMRDHAMTIHGNMCWWCGEPNPEFHHWAYPNNAWVNLWADDTPDLIIPLCGDGEEHHEFLELSEIKELIDSKLGKAYFRKHRRDEYFNLMTRILTLKDQGLEPEEIIDQLKSECDNDKT